MSMRRGEIYYVDLSGTRGSEVSKERPCIIIQNDVGNKFGATTIIVPISHKSRRLLPTQMELTCDMLESGLTAIDGVVQCEQVRTVDKTRVGTLLGALTPEALKILNKALLISMGL